MISKLKRKFTALATAAMLLLMAVLLLIMNMVNYSSVVTECDSILDLLSRPEAKIGENRPLPNKPGLPTDDFIPNGMSPEVPYESRYFTVLLTGGGEIIESDLSRVVSVDSDAAEQYIIAACQRRQDRGFIGQFRYARSSSGQNTRIIFLDCGRRLDSFRSFLRTSIMVGLFGCLIVFVAFLFMAGRIIKPIAESYEKQKRFISDAGHEIKTPLTIINANVELLSGEDEKEELADIRQQTKRLAELTNNLIFLSKMEENEHTAQKIDLPLSDTVSEAAASFHAAAAAKGICLTEQITPGISISGFPDALRRLVLLLLDNAVKYSPAGGTITVGLLRSRRFALLSVHNTTDRPVDSEELPHVFDRFYRSDSSRNSAAGGHGIGLSIAKAITEAHGGRITAENPTGRDFLITVSLPL